MQQAVGLVGILQIFFARMAEAADVVERMVADAVPAFDDHTVDVGMLAHVVSHHEESGLDTESVQCVQHKRGGFGYRSVIECQIDYFLLAAHPPYRGRIEPSEKDCGLFYEHGSLWVSDRITSSCLSGGNVKHSCSLPCDRSPLFSCL